MTRLLNSDISPKYGFIEDFRIKSWRKIQEERKLFVKQKCQELGLNNKTFKLISKNFVLEPKSQTRYCLLHKGG